MVLWKKGVLSQALCQVLSISLGGVIFKTRMQYLMSEDFVKGKVPSRMLLVVPSGSGLCTIGTC